ncbi:hypothetical protein GCK32_000970 [Trichostrongylus colubriformis]|uniref:Uncharacterized protein n=1 Tax=Trichostrongylus colubriformis TaxID=6319 RepID=A0AAN8F0P0_TRICO
MCWHNTDICAKIYYHLSERKAAWQGFNDWWDGNKKGHLFSSVEKPANTLQLMSEVPLPAYVLFHWSIAFVLWAPLCTSFDNSYNSRFKPDVLVPPAMLAFAVMMSLIAVVVFFSISMLCYILILIHVLNFNYLRNSSNRYEFRLCIQAAGLLIAFLLLFIYNTGQFIINRANDLPLLFTWRLFNPLVTGFLSWVQPWMCLALNTEVRQNVLRILFCRRKNLFVSRTSIVSVAKQPPLRFALPEINERRASIPKQ